MDERLEMPYPDFHFCGDAEDGIPEQDLYTKRTVRRLVRRANELLAAARLEVRTPNE